MTFQGMVSARKALQLSLNVPAVELLSALGPQRFLSRLRDSGVAIAMPKEGGAPGLAIGLGGLGITLAGSDPALCRAGARRRDAAAAVCGRRRIR